MVNSWNIASKLERSTKAKSQDQVIKVDHSEDPHPRSAAVPGPESGVRSSMDTNTLGGNDGWRKAKDKEGQG